ncbi:MAG: methyl-accepting chemotaxis protein [Lysobacteraceae bacterium]|nr:MAG: methyl-accepting chemotaxis protein [Xanthomonadaceae bacterium]
MSTSSGLFGSIRNRLTYGTLALSLIPLLLAGTGLTYFALQSSRQALEERAYDQLQSTANIKATEITAYVANLRRELLQLAGNGTFADSSRTMAQAQLALAAGLPVPIDQARAELRQWYLQSFKPAYDAKSPGKPIDFAKTVDALPAETVAVQYLYIVKNPKQDARDEFVDAGDGSTYSATHVRLHKAMLAAIAQSNYTDLHIADPVTGNLFYTSAKEPDIGTNLLNGPLKDSGMAQAFRAALKLKGRDSVWMSEYASFYPAEGDVSAFIAAPIYADTDSEQVVGVLIGQFPVSALNTVMTFGRKWREVGLGESGEAYLVGSDKTARSVSRFLTENLNGYLGLMQQIGAPKATIDQMRLQNTNVGLQQIDTFGAREALAGRRGESVYPDYRNIPVLGAYQPIQVLNNRWALLSEIDDAEAFASIDKLQRNLLIAAAAALAILGLIAFLFGRRLATSINAPLSQVQDTVVKVGRGDLDARTGLNSGDEIGTLAKAFDGLLDDKVTELARAQKENEQLNNSVIDIMTSVAQLAQRDLNIKVPVSEDVTGAVSDAINMMTSSTARALQDVNSISTQVSDSSSRVKERADTVFKLADEASNQANAASAELSTTANALRQIGEQAQGAGREAERALVTTGEAMSVVRATVEGITASRDQIRETEKRVKRLAERSQEISSAVTIIGQIAERTSVLALNASMQAVAAGEAGRGFAVVADEVKRLAENAREATQQIAGLVNAIQSDTTETLQAMNGTIAQVVDITRLADRAGAQMNDTRQATEALVNSVRTISQATQTQGEASQRLLARAYELISASQRTLEEIELQRGDTQHLSESASALVRTVSEFRLPG